MWRNKSKALLFLLLCTLTLVSCSKGNGGLVGGKEQRRLGYYSLSYIRFSGTKDVSFTLKRDKVVTIRVLTTKGSLNMTVLGEDERGVVVPLYEGKDLPTGVSPLELSAGEYRVEIDAHKHVGNFSIAYG